MKPGLSLGKYAAEAFATFALMFCGTGAIAANEVSNGAVTHVGICLVFGLIVLAMIDLRLTHRLRARQKGARQ